MVTATFAYDDDEEGYFDSQHLCLYNIEETARRCMMDMEMGVYMGLSNIHASARATCCCSEELAFKLPQGTSEIAYHAEIGGHRCMQSG